MSGYEVGPDAESPAQEISAAIQHPQLVTTSDAPSSALMISPAVNKRKKVNAPLDVQDLRRSRRLAGLSVGFKDWAAANKA